MNGFPILSAILFLPLAGAIGAALLPRVAGWGWSLLVALADLVLALVLIGQFVSNGKGFQFVEHQSWLPGAGINYALGVDGVNLFLLALNALLTLVAVGASWQVVRSGDRTRQYIALMMLLSAGMQGVFLATNLFLFYVFWELMLVPAYLLVGMFGGPRRAYAAIKFVLYTVAGSLLMLVGIIALGAVVSTRSGRPFTLDLTALLQAGVPQDAQLLLFLAFAAAFAIKAGLFPFHSWVPDTYGEAPTAVVVLLAGVMAKTGVYGFVRYCLPLFPDAARQLTLLISILAIVGILYFALEALVAQDFKRLLAYVSISHMGVIILGIFALNVQGVEGGIVQMVNHGIIIAALFLIAGYIEERTGTRRLADFGGLATRLPWLATVFFIAALAALGLPGLNSFAGEFLAFLGTFRANVLFGTLGTLVVVPAAWYMLRFFQGVMEGSVPTDGQVGAAVASASAQGSRQGRTSAVPLTDLRLGEFLVLLPLLALIIYLGIAPGVLTARMESSVSGLLGLTENSGSSGNIQRTAAPQASMLVEPQP
ncbi:MAG TPA: NADH-quinone oxidoreductase subunit M [Ktedonobacterales bacterium]|nr:NADH-quinone oxidoreductase subunit M [Ktedonobacterales bacterium]